MHKPQIHVTRPSLAPLKEFTQLLTGAWESGVLTHNGPLVQELEKQLASYLRVSHLSTVANGTLALQLAIRALGLRGEIITTPFSWVATISAIIWERCQPVFVDIDPETLNLDPAQIEARITRHTSAILPVHVFGNPCNTRAISEIATRHKLKVIYDGAHAFNVSRNGHPLAECGDITALSFHATKLFNTGEGGACVTRDRELDTRIRRLRFFGHDADKVVVDDGTNAKMTEIHAALGLANLPYAGKVEEKRKEDYRLYRSLLAKTLGLTFQKIEPDEYNYCYMPVIFANEASLLKVEHALNAQGIVPRRYFYPALNTLAHIVPYQHFPVAESISRRILCLPHYFDMSSSEIERICSIINDSVSHE